MKTHWFVVVCVGILSGICLGCGAGLTSQSSSAASNSSLAPQVSGISPNAVAMGVASFILRVSGSNLNPGSTLLWNGAPQSSTSVNSDSLTSVIPAAAISKPEQVQVSVRDPVSGLTSNAMTFTVSNTAAPVSVTTAQLPESNADQPYAADLLAQGGMPPYRWSLSSGILPNGMSMTSTGAISGQPLSSGQFPFTVQVADSSPSPVTAAAPLNITVTANASTSTSTDTATSGFYGPGVGGDSLGNTALGPFGNVASYRFRATHSGAVDKIRVYLIPDRIGYAAGTGGEMQVSIEPDDGTAAHAPSGTQLATTELAKPLAETGTARYFPVLSFAVHLTITAGELYHIVFKNVDLNPLFNFISVDSLYNRYPSTPNQPTVSDLDSAVLLSQDSALGKSSWVPRQGYTPI
ncbi:MAG: putative Ig domain-containing protein, partial [Candidatus Acidiferrales bacterium]